MHPVRPLMLDTGLLTLRIFDSSLQSSDVDRHDHDHHLCSWHKNICRSRRIASPRRTKLLHAPSLQSVPTRLSISRLSSRYPSTYIIKIEVNVDPTLGQLNTASETIAWIVTETKKILGSSLFDFTPKSREELLDVIVGPINTGLSTVFEFVRANTLSFQHPAARKYLRSVGWPRE